MRRLTRKHKLRQVRRQRRLKRRWARVRRLAYAHARVGPGLVKKALSAGWVMLAAPEDLSWRDGQLERLCGYLDRIRTEVLHHNRKVMVDLSTCQSLSSLACLMLCAEVQRCQELRPGMVNGIDPRSRRARSLLYAMGFHDHLKTPGRRSVQHKSAIQIRSGLGSDETIASDAHEVAEVALKVFPDGTFARRVHSALNEALGNVQMWAYGGCDPGRCLEGRWWVAGLANHADNEAFFYALDHGVGIPATAPKSMPEMLAERWGAVLGAVGIDQPTDHEILAAVINERRTKSRKSQHGKGIASMIALAELADEGNFEIYSGRAAYSLASAASEGASTEPQAFAEPLSYTFPGTLLIWRVKGPKLTTGPGDDEQGD